MTKLKKIKNLSKINGRLRRKSCNQSRLPSFPSWKASRPISMTCWHRTVWSMKQAPQSQTQQVQPTTSRKPCSLSSTNWLMWEMKSFCKQQTASNSRSSDVMVKNKNLEMTLMRTKKKKKNQNRQNQIRNKNNWKKKKMKNSSTTMRKKVTNLSKKAKVKEHPNCQVLQINKTNKMRRMTRNSHLQLS